MSLSRVARVCSDLLNEISREQQPDPVGATGALDLLDPDEG